MIVEETARKYIAKKQGGLRSGRGCVDEIFALKQLVEKCRLEKGYGRVCRKELWRILHECRVQ